MPWEGAEDLDRKREDSQEVEDTGSCFLGLLQGVGRNLGSRAWGRVFLKRAQPRTQNAPSVFSPIIIRTKLEAFRIQLVKGKHLM